MYLYKACCLLLSAFTLTTCAVGPDYKAPEAKVPAAWSGLSAKGVSARSIDIVRWWETFSDPMLNSLVERAVASNLDVRIAEARLREARAARDVTAADLWPNLNSSGTYSRTHVNTKASSSGSKAETSSQSQSQPTASAQGQAQTTAKASTTSSAKRPSSHADLFKAGFDATWELDIFGGVRRSVEAADATIGAAREDYRAVIVSLLAEVALNYADLCGVQRRITITENNLKTQKDTLEITQARYDAGLTSKIDVLKASAEVAATQSQIPALEALAKRSVHRLGILTGKEPGALLSELSQPRPIPPVPLEVPVDLPSDLLRRRPDIAAAERRLAAATAGIGVAVAELFPKFSLTGSFGRQGEHFRDLRVGSNKTLTYGPEIQWPIFEAGRITANIKVQNARQEQALGTYEKAVLTALEDVENSLVDYSNEQTRQLSLSEAVTSNLESVTLSRDLYTQGLTDFLNVLDAQRALYITQDQLVQSEQKVVTNLIALYKALGGGWEVYSKSE